MANVFHIARYVIEKCGSLTTMKLQKLVYYCQSWSLAWDEKPLFEERIEAWANGPVCPDLYNLHKGLYVVSDSFLIEYAEYPFTDNEKETMDNVIKFYGDKEPWWLSELTHQEAPWKEARKGVPDGMPCSNEIKKELMQQYYGGLDG